MKLPKLIKKQTDKNYPLPIRYNLNTSGAKTGPNIFGKRLKIELKKQGWVYDKRAFDYNIAFIAGKYYPGKINVLRLDGLYFDTENTVGDNEELNTPIKKSYHGFDKIIFQSRFSKDMFFHHLGEINTPYKIIYNGAPRSFPSADKKIKYPFDKTIICSARWRSHKRLAAIIEGFKELNQKSIGLVILGKATPQINHENIIYLGDVNPRKLPYYIRGADAFIHLSWLDWCPNTVVEALVCGLPVLCSHNGGTKELVKDSGIIFEFEETYDFERVPLYKPPVPDPKLVARGMSELLEWSKPIERADLYIDHVARQYTDFILE